ncbi:MAG: tetratricopeptide repeat protein [Verrucomicrobiota bacterium]
MATEAQNMEQHPAFKAALKAAEKGEHKTMLEYAVTLMNAYPDNATSYLLLGDAYRLLDHPELAVECYREAVESSEASILKKLKLPGKDHSETQTALKQESDLIMRLLEMLSFIGISTRALCNIGTIHKEQGNTEKAIAAYEQASIILSSCVQTLYNTALAYAEDEQFHEAVTVLEKCVHLDADFAEAWGLLGICYFELNRPADSVAACKRAKTLRPDLIDMQIFLGLSYQRLELYQQAIEAFENLITDDPDYAEAYVSLGMIFLTLGESEKAIDALSEAVEISPAYSEAYFSLGLAYFMEGDYEKGNRIMQFLRLSAPEEYERFLLNENDDWP